MAGGQPPTGRWVRTRDNLAKRVSRPPVPRQPVQRLWVSRPTLKDLRRDRQEYVEVERASPALTDQSHGFFVAQLNPLAKLPRENVTSLDRKAVPPTSPCHRAMKNVFFQPSVIDVPWDRPGSARRLRECRDVSRRPADRQMMPEPGRCRVGRWERRGDGPPAPSFRRERDAVRWRRDRGRGGFSVPGCADQKRQRSSIPAGLSVTRPARRT